MRASLLACSLAALVGCSATPDSPAPATPLDSPKPIISTSASSTEAAPPTPSHEPSQPRQSPSANTSVTVSSTSSADPAQDAARYASVIPSFEQYWAVINETYAAGGAAEPTQGMRDTMTGNQLAYWSDAFAAFKAARNQYSGKNKVAYAEPKSVVLKPDDGLAEVAFCLDMRDTKAVDVHGHPLKKDGLFQKGIAGLLWREGRWKVAGFLKETAFVSSC